MVHGNARLTVRGRSLIIERARQGGPQAHIAAAMGVSRQCVRRWTTRFHTEGHEGLRDRSSRPHTCPQRADATTEKAVIGLRGSERLGRDRISDRHGVPARTVSRILARNGSPHLAMLDPITGELIRASKATSARCDRERPGELAHMNVKKLGRIPDGRGWKAHGCGHESLKL